MQYDFFSSALEIVRARISMNGSLRKRGNSQGFRQCSNWDTTRGNLQPSEGWFKVLPTEKSEFAVLPIVTMDLLAKHIGERLSKNYRFCRIFENELERVWPVDSEDQQLRERRIKKIRAFADAHGWTANINDPGLQVTFRKKRGDAPGSSK